MKSHHVVHDPNGGWNVKESGVERGLKHFETKKEAEDYGRKISKEEKTELFIHGEDGKIQRRDSHGNDPKGGG